MPAKTDTKITPVTVTRGSEPTSLSQKLHWIAGTFKGRKTIELPSIFTQNFVPCKGYLNYSTGSLFDDGRKTYSTPGRPEWGTHMIWSGQACDACPIDPIDLVDALLTRDFSFTRLDMAIDVKNANLRPSRATEEIEHGRIKTSAKQYPAWHNAGAQGYTQYVGKKSSEIYLKLYDKAAEMGIDGDHTRIELTVRAKRANIAAREMVQRRDFRGMVVSFADFPQWNEWRAAFSVAPVKLPADRVTSSTKTWLLRACAPALAKQMIVDGEDGFYFKFLDAVREYYRQLSNSVQTVH